MNIVPKRQCGPCKACCRELKIAVPQFRKDGGVLCPHHTGTGCGIYERRYPVCQAFFCGWRLLAELDAGWRPDLSGVLIVRRDANSLPRRYRTAGHGLQFDILGGEAAVRRLGFAAYVAGLMAKGVPVYLSAFSPAALVNDHLDPGKAARDLPGTLERLLHLYRLLDAASWRRSLLRRIAPLYRLEVERLRLRAGRNDEQTERLG